MLYDIKIKVDYKQQIDSIINHALNLGYYVDLNQESFLQKAKYLILDPNQSMRWCTEEVYNQAGNYMEYDFKTFIDYPGYSRCSCGERLPDLCTDWTCLCGKKWSY